MMAEWSKAGDLRSFPRMRARVRISLMVFFYFTISGATKGCICEIYVTIHATHMNETAPITGIHISLNFPFFVEYVRVNAIINPTLNVPINTIIASLYMLFVVLIVLNTQ